MSDKSKKEETNRLLDLDVREVSVVDRPANQSPFLIVKNADGVLDIKLEETMQGPDKDRDDAVVEILDLVTKEEEVEVPEAKEAPDLQAVVEQAAESLMKAAALLKEQQGAEPSQEALDGIAEASGALQEALPSDQESDESAEASDDSSDESESVEDAGLQVYIEKDGDEQCVVVKRGAKMKKARLDQFRKAIDVLNGILKELDGSEQKMNKDDAQKVEKTEEPAAKEKVEKQVEEQAAPPAEQPAEEPAEEQEAASEEAPAAEPEEVEKSDPAPEPTPEPAPAPDVDVVAKLTEAVEKALSPVVEKIDNLTKRVNELENEGTSNGDAEAGELEQTQKSEEKNLWKGLFDGLR
jgi:hypothetical protein